MDPPTSRPRIADVAREAGVSKTAVSFAFNSPDRLAPETVGRIRAVADGLGYRPDPVARMFTQGETLTIGVLTPQALSVIFSNPFFGAFSEGVALAAEESGFAPPVHLAAAWQSRACDRVERPSTVSWRSACRTTTRRSTRSGARVCRSSWSTRPRSPSTAPSRSTTSAAPGAAAEHLVALGHRDVVVIGVEPPSPAVGIGPVGSHGPAPRRVSRPVRRRRRSTVPDDRRDHRPSLHRRRPSAPCARHGLAGLRPTAILTMSDAMAIGAMHGLRELGLRVPDDVSVVGFDDIDLAAHVDPPLTTIHQPIRRKGEEAVRLLLSVIERAWTVPKPEHRRLETRSDRSRLDRPCACDRTSMSVDTPDWVRDAVFYQIFPDRFASSERVVEARPAGAVGRPADRPTGSRAATFSGSPSTCRTCRSR